MSENRDPFHCSMCGACCMSIAAIEGFAKMDDGTGTCKLFDKKTRKCKVYDQRPTLCDVEKLYDKLFAKSMSWEQYLQMNYDACKELRANLGIPEPE